MANEEHPEPGRVEFDSGEEYKLQNSEQIQNRLGQLYKETYMSLPSSTEESRQLVDAKKYNTGAIRKLLTAAFSDEDFTNFCFDYFRPTYEKFAGGLTRSVKIQLLIEDCDRYDKFEELLDRAREENPTRYAEFANSLQTSEQASSAILSSTKKLVQIKIAGDLSKATVEQKQAVIGAIKGTFVYTFNIASDEVVILMDDVGSIVLNLLLPTDVANELVAMQKANAPIIQDLGILQAKLINTRGFDLSGLNLSKLNLSGADLFQINLSRANLVGTNLSEANLNGVDLNWTNLSRANLRGTRLTGAQLFETNLRWVDLQRAELRETYLFGTDFRGANISEVDLTNANVGYTIFGNVDLSTVKGLDTVKHIGPSTIDASTFTQSKGQIPEVFLRGCGLSDLQIEMAKLHNPQLNSVQIAEIISRIQEFLVGKVRYYSCFISYSSKDEAFAQRLHTDLQQNGVRAWFAPADMKIGEKVRPRIDESIRIHDKLLLILSEQSISSPWVEYEIQTAFEEERKRNETMLFPVRLDKAVMETDQAWAADIRHSRHIGDFSRWKDHDAYQQAFERLLRDLKAEG